MMPRTLTTMSLSVFLAVGMCGPSANAQDQSSAGAAQTPTTAGTVTGRRPNPKRELKRLGNQLSLTPDQEAKLEPIVQARDQQIGTINSDTTLSEEQRQTKIRAIRTGSEPQIEAVLTSAQKQQYEQTRQNREAKMKGAQPQPSASPAANPQ